MHLRQRSSRYCAAVLFMAGLNGIFLLAAIILSKFRPGFEIWMASALVVSLILHARAGFALTRAQQEIELLSRQLNKISLHPKKHKAKKQKPEPGLKIEESDNLDKDDSDMLSRVKGAIENDRIDLYLQPIVSLPQRKLRFYEAFSRLRNDDNSVLRPVHYLEAAERANRIGVIDNMILLRSVQALRNLGAESKNHRIFCNISPATIYDEDFFARFADYLDANADMASRLVFEFTGPAVEIMHGRIEKNLEAIAERGYAFSVDNIRRLDMDWAGLKQKNFQFVKAPSSVLMGAAHGDEKAKSRIQNFKDRLGDNDIDLIVEKVERESHMPEILALGIDYGQGTLFGSPEPAADLTAPTVVALAKAS